MKTKARAYKISRLVCHLKRSCLPGKVTKLFFFLFFSLSIIGCNDSSSFDITLAGNVKDTHGAAVQGVDIAFNWSDGGSLVVVTDGDGCFKHGYDWWDLDGTPALTVVITPSHPDYSFSPPEYLLDAERDHFDLNFIATLTP